MVKKNRSKRRGSSFLLLLILFFLLTLTKIFFSFFIHSIHIVFDESNYFLIAYKFWFEGSYSIGNSSYPQYPPLYPLLLSPFTTFKDTEQCIQYILILNSIISSTIVFPCYYLSKEYLTERSSILTSFLIGIAPPMFIYSFSIMSENIFFPLFLTAVYFIVRVSKEDTVKNNLLAGLFISFCVLVKLIALPLILVYGVVKLYQSIQQ